MSAENKWTPGPWVAREDRVYFEGSGISLHGCNLGPRAEATARLIAAAPEMYEALASLRVALDRHEYHHTATAIDALLRKIDAPTPSPA